MKAFGLLLWCNNCEFQAIWLELQEAVHAVDSMDTKTSAEAGL